MMKTFLIFFLFISALFANPLQDAINQAAPFSIIKLQKGLYKGNIIIDKPLSIEGLEDDVIIEGDGLGSVVTISASSVSLNNITIQKSGTQMHRLDAAISMKKVSSCKIRHCKILDSLYGIDMDMVQNSLIEENYITSKKYDIGLRGDGLKLYYSNNNIIRNNTIEAVRDITLNYSHNNYFESNTILKNRFGVHLSLSKGNTFHKNEFRYNSIGIMLMGAKDTNITNNILNSSQGAAGIAVMIGSVNNMLFEKNRVSYNAKALYIDGKEKEEGIKRYIIDNEISHNGEAFHFHATIKKNKIVNNRIFGNINDVVKDVAGEFSDTNIVEYNYWDRYSGFDRDKDGIGDRPHIVYQYADQLWHYNHKIKFFYASPIMTLLNFLSELAPFIEPHMIMKDSKPLMRIED